MFGAYRAQTICSPMPAKSAPAQKLDKPAQARSHALTAGLNYTSDEKPGITRKGSTPADFTYHDTAGKRIKDEATLTRIRKLAIPPAYTDVWISPDANGHLQATGRDGRKRKQYRYHADWRQVRDDTKYARLMEFGKALPSLREKLSKDMGLPGLSRQKVLAAVVRLLETTLIRIGNEEYEKQNKSFGLTTLKDRHVKVDGGKVRFKFLGKSKVNHDITLSDRRLATIVKKCRDIPGQALFQYYDEEGQRHSIGSADVNAYLHEVTGQDFTAKDFRTWAGTVLATLALQAFEMADSATAAKHNIVEAVKNVSQRLGNTPSVCRKCYIHPAVLDSYLEGTLLDSLRQKTHAALADMEGLKAEEGAVLAFLAGRLALEHKTDSTHKKTKDTASAHTKGSPKARKLAE